MLITTDQVPIYTPGWREAQFCVITMPKGANLYTGLHRTHDHWIMSRTPSPPCYIEAIIILLMADIEQIHKNLILVTQQCRNILLSKCSGIAMINTKVIVIGESYEISHKKQKTPMQICLMRKPPSLDYEYMAI